MAKRYVKQSVLDAVENYKTNFGFIIVNYNNQIICYSDKYKALIFTETEDGTAYTQITYNKLPKKYNHLFNIKEQTNEKGEIKYLAHCIEYGEKFVTSFYAPKGTPKAELLSMGQDEASEWGAECYKVTIA